MFYIHDLYNVGPYILVPYMSLGAIVKLLAYRAKTQERCLPNLNEEYTGQVETK